MRMRTAVAVAACVMAAACTGAPPAPIDPGGPAAATSTPAAGPKSAAAPTGTAPGTPPNCRPGELRASLGPEDGAAGSVNVALLLTNTGGRTCELRGFLGVSYVAGDDGHQVGPAAAMAGERGGEVVLKPGAAAGAQLRLVNVQNYDAAVCKPTPVRGLRVYPPGDTASLYVARPGTGCAGTPPGNQIEVRTLAPA